MAFLWRTSASMSVLLMAACGTFEAETMEGAQCKLKVYWRSFWASCGDKQRFEWRDSAQVSEASFEPDESKRG